MARVLHRNPSAAAYGVEYGAVRGVAGGSTYLRHSVGPITAHSVRHNASIQSVGLRFCRRTVTQYNIRTRAHNKTLISKTSQLNDRDFLIRMLYKDSY